MALYEGDLEGFHFVVLLDAAHVASVIWSMRRGWERFKKQVRRPVVNAAVALAHWRHTVSGSLMMHTDEVDFDEVCGVNFVVCVGWKHSLYCSIEHVQHPRAAVAGKPHPPAQITVSIRVHRIVVTPPDREQPIGPEEVAAEAVMEEEPW